MNLYKYYNNPQELSGYTSKESNPDYLASMYEMYSGRYDVDELPQDIRWWFERWYPNASIQLITQTANKIMDTRHVTWSDFVNPNDIDELTFYGFNLKKFNELCDEQDDIIDWGNVNWDDL